MAGGGVSSGDDDSLVTRSGDLFQKCICRDDVDERPAIILGTNMIRQNQAARIRRLGCFAPKSDTLWTSSERSIDRDLPAYSDGPPAPTATTLPEPEAPHTSCFPVNNGLPAPVGILRNVLSPWLI